MSLSPLTVCFVWHMHQPDYKDHLSGRYMMPWVRLHAVKDYLDMVTLLKDFPRIRQTFNLVPSLLDQLEEYSRPHVWDRHQELTLQSAFNDEDRHFILNRFFDAHPHRMIARIPYYWNLYERRNQLPSLESEQHSFSDQELADITALFHLVWFDPQWIETNPELRALFEKGQHYTLEDRARILEIQRELIREILPTYKAFQEAGQIEITLTPYYHPILPLLIDSESAKIGRPGALLPPERFQHPEDARVQMEKAIEKYQQLFGVNPSGVWPSEQSICPETLKLFADLGLKWAVSNEGNLARSLGLQWDKDDYGHCRNVEALARPYRYADMNLLFRNLTLSDMIGFTYASFDPEAAAEDCYQRLKRIQSQMAAHPDILDPVVTIALDGENCWESYALDGAPFLRALYQRLSEDTSLNVSRVQDYLAQCAPQAIQPLSMLHAGSWIDSDFHIWIGDPVKNTAWTLLKQTRDDLVRFGESENLPESLLQQAWQEIYIAQGSDWFWWYGEPHSSGQDHLFDFQFRLHLKNVYTLLSKDPPENLHTPLSPATAKRHVAEPRSSITPALEGRLTTADEWKGAGRYDLAAGEGAMHRGDRLLTCLYYGFDLENLYFRFDLQPDLLRKQHRLALYFCTPHKIRYNSPIRLKSRPGLMSSTQKYLYAYEVQLQNICTPELQVFAAEAVSDYLWIDRPDIRIKAVFQDFLEVSIPFAGLNTYPQDWLQMALAVAEGDVIIDFAPHDALISAQRPVLLPQTLMR